jgi:hypothetical protein
MVFAQVMAEDQRSKSGVFYTGQMGAVPPLITTSFVTVDQGNSSPRFIRSSMYNIPATIDMMKQVRNKFNSPDVFLIVIKIADVDTVWNRDQPNGRVGARGASAAHRRLRRDGAGEVHSLQGLYESVDAVHGRRPQIPLPAVQGHLRW